AVQRSASKSTMASIDQSVDQIHRGASVLVFPEGTRSIDGTLGDFKRGAFLLAYRSGKPIVPVTVIDSYKIFPKGKLEFNPVSIKVIINEPIEVPDLQNKSEEIKLMNKIRLIINENIKFRGMNVS
ncbi:MAG TPA: lysophospholipid acyltransferase family protein, partial [Bacteroidota bacterium]|nr:lysophospholipid acyltransferase family protein [Bacteroidota bacterium]